MTSKPTIRLGVEQAEEIAELITFAIERGAFQDLREVNATLIAHGLRNLCRDAEAGSQERAPLHLPRAAWDKKMEGA